MPRIVVVIGNLSRVGGAERQAMYLVEHLAQLGTYETSVLTFEDGGALRPALAALGVPVHVVAYDVNWSRARRFTALARLVSLLRSRVKPDAILPFGAPSSKTVGLVWRLSGARFMWWNQQDEGRGLSGTPAERRILGNAPSIISNSYVGRDFLVSKYGLGPEKVLVYNNGTPLPDSAALIDGDGLGAGKRRVVSMVANVTRFKDHSTLIEAWGHVVRHFSGDDRPMLVLAGHMRQRRLAESLKTKAFDLGVSGNDVKFLGAIDNVPQLLRESDLVVHSSLTEGCPNAVCEAMAFGRAVVATDIPGCRQALGDASAEWLVEPKNSSLLAQKIIMMLENDELREECGKANRRRIESEFSMSGMYNFFVGQLVAGLARTA